MKLFPKPILAGLLFGFLGSTRLAAADAAGELADEPLLTIRAKDGITLHVRRAYLTFSETFVVTPAAVTPDRTTPGATSIVHLLIAPFWLRDGSQQGPAFPVLRPQLTPSHGRVRRFALVHPNGETVQRVDDITLDCRYVLTLEFGHMLPDRLTIAVQMSSPTGLNPGAELIYTPSNDGHPFRSGPPESFQTVVHVIADEDLEPWQVMQDGREIPRAGARVTLDREVSHTFRFGSTVR